ncbi:MAG TPA: asparagine synthase-related protein [Smithellaceae bacterium]|nr:asparagine synthase-related protein [Smithellaceae bacterium]
MNKIKEIKASTMNVKKFIDEKVREIRETVGDGLAINALSGGVDSSVVTALGHRALGRRLKTYFIDNGIMREGEPARVAAAFKKLGIQIEVLDASKEFFSALKGLTDPEEKREAITQTFYKKIFSRLVIKSKAKYLLQGTILTDVDETVAGIKRQHNVFAQLGIDPQKAFGYKILEPLIELRKDGVRKAGRGLGLPESMFDRIPFPGPALAARVIGEVTPARIALVKKATNITEAALKDVKAFQYLAILHEDRVTGMRNNKRVFGNQIEIRCWDSLDARTARPTRLSFDILEKIAAKITKDIPEVVSVTYNITTKPTSTIEAI